MPQARILVVEDDAPLALNLRHTLTELGYEVAGVTARGEEAVELASALLPDLILMDVRLQDAMDGVFAAQLIRDRLRLPVVFLTAHADETTVRRARATEPLGYIVKPVSRCQLRIAVELALHKHRADSESLQASKMEAIGRFAGGVAHDFNNLLTVINGYSALLLTAIPHDHPWRGFVDEVSKAGERAAAVTRQLLAFSRRQPQQPRAIDLNQVVAGVQHLLPRLLGGRIDVTAALEPGLGPVSADPGQLEQVLLNLATNARDAMPQGGRLTLETAGVEISEADRAARPGLRPGPHRRLRVSDTGCGMSEAVRARVFEPFFTTRPAGQGSGMGLALVYAVVRQAGGYIDVESAIGRGTTFTLYLPAAAAEAAEAAAPPPGLPRGTETLLLVDDQDDVRGLARRVLTLCGYAVLEAAGGVEALQLSGQYPSAIDLLVTDVVMPRMGGRELAAQLVAQRPGLPVLYVTGNPDRDGAATAPAEGAAVLYKPYAPAALARAVREALDRAKGR